MKPQTKRILYTGGTIVMAGLLALFTLMCNGGNTPPPEPTVCACDPKAHLGIGENCDCGADVCNDCTVQEYGRIGGTVPVYRKGNVTNTEVLGLVTTLTNGYNTLGGSQAAFKNNISAIHVLPAGFGIDHQGNIILVGCDTTLQVIMPHLATNGFLSSIQLNKSIRLTNDKKMPWDKIVAFVRARVPGTVFALCT